jgi:hypothetical protein
LFFLTSQPFYFPATSSFYHVEHFAQKQDAAGNTPKVQAPFGVYLLHPLLIIQGYLNNRET